VVSQSKDGICSRLWIMDSGNRFLKRIIKERNNTRLENCIMRSFIICTLQKCCKENEMCRYYFFIILSRIILIPLGTAATTGLLYQMILEQLVE
jgi:hypothetical protein